MVERIPNPYINVGAIDMYINDIHIIIGTKIGNPKSNPPPLEGLGEVTEIRNMK